MGTSLPYLRKFDVPIATQQMAASSEHLFVDNISTVVVYDFQGTEIRRFSAGGTAPKLDYANDLLYRLGQYPPTLTPYTDEGDAQTAIAFDLVSASSQGLTSNTLIRDFVIAGELLHVFYRGTGGDFRKSYNFPSLTRADTNPAIALPSSLRTAKSITRRSDGFFVLKSDGTVVALDPTFGFDTVDDIDFAGELTAGAAMAWNGHALCVYASTEVFLFGEEVPAPLVPAVFVPTQQYFLFQNYEERFDIVAVGQDNSISEVKHSHIAAIRQTDSRHNVAESLSVLLNTILLIPKFTVDDIETGDIVFRHLGSPETEPTQVPAERWRVDGVESVGHHYRQIITATRVTE